MKLLQAIGIDADDCKVIAVILVVVLLVGLLLVLLAGAMGLAVNLFEVLRGL